MIIGSIEVQNGAVVTHRDSFILTNVSVVSVRRPYLAGSVLLASAALGFVASFVDLLYPNELIAITVAATFLFSVGFKTAQLTLLSRDLKGSELSSAVWGTSGDLQRERAKIVKERQLLLAHEEILRTRRVRHGHA